MDYRGESVRGYGNLFLPYGPPGVWGTDIPEERKEVHMYVYMY